MKTYGWRQVVDAHPVLAWEAFWWRSLVQAVLRDLEEDEAEIEYLKEFAALRNKGVEE